MTYADIYAYKTNDIPDKEHWAILITRSIHILGDERSRTNPGHGYPESTEYSIEYRVYLSEEKFKDALLREWNNPHSTAKGIHVDKQYEKSVSVIIKEK